MIASGAEVVPLAIGAVNGCHTIPTRDELKISFYDYKRLYESKIEELVTSYDVELIFPAFDDCFIDQIASINKKFNLPGIQNSTTLNSKIKYYQLLDDIINIPDIYQIRHNGNLITDLKEVTFPCICKPENGTGGIGIFKANNFDDLEWFFGPEKHLNFIDENKRFLLDKNSKGYMNYLHRARGGLYAVVEALNGYIVSIDGVYSSDGIFIDCQYDIDTKNQTDFALSVPSKCKIDFIEIYQKIFSTIKIPYGPFMSDFIITPNNKAYLIDFSPRIGYAGFRLIHAVDKRYCQRIINSILGKPVGEYNELPPLYSQFFDFKKGSVKEIKYPENPINMVDCRKLVKSGTELLEMKGDFQMQARGYATFTGKSLLDAKRGFFKYQHGIKIKYYE